VTDNHEENEAEAQDEKSKSSGEISKVVGTAFGPAAQEFGDEFKDVGRDLAKIAKTGVKSANVLMSPLSAVVWGYDRIRDWVTSDVEEKLANTPPEQRQSPDLQVAAPAIEAISYTGDKPDLREAFANLLANAMDRSTAKDTHPAFVDVLRQLTSDEAKLLKEFGHSGVLIPLIEVRAYSGNNPDDDYSTPLRQFSSIGYAAGCENPENIERYIDNLCRLEILRIPEGLKSAKSGGIYEMLEQHHIVQTIIEQAQESSKHMTFCHKVAEFTAFGKAFFDLCIVDKE
jgi:hypothetical protein